MFTNKDDTLVAKPKQRAAAKVGRNDPCPCEAERSIKTAAAEMRDI